MGILSTYKSKIAASDTTVVFRDNAFADDVAKANLAAILEQYGLGNVQNL